MQKAACRVRIVKAGSEIEIEGDRAFIEDMLPRLEALAGGSSARTETREKSPTAPDAAASKGVSAREFIHKLKIKKHTDITLAFGYYLERYSGLEGFTPGDINQCYYDAKMEPSNTSQTIIQNIRHGYMMEAKSPEAGGRRRYRLTKTGEEFVQEKAAAPTE
jgi:hypothetical protein